MFRYLGKENGSQQGKLVGILQSWSAGFPEETLATSVRGVPKEQLG